MNTKVLLRNANYWEILPDYISQFAGFAEEKELIMYAGSSRR
jgi:hypothetical protein